MYIINRNDRRFNNKTFSRYEEARSYVRKWVRKNLGVSDFDYSANEYRNPSIDMYGFSIKRVDA